MVLPEIITRTKTVEDGKVAIKVDPIKAVTALEVAIIKISLTVEAQEPPLITNKFVHSCKSHKDALKVQ